MITMKHAACYQLSAEPRIRSYSASSFICLPGHAPYHQLYPQAKLINIILHIWSIYSHRYSRTACCNCSSAASSSSREAPTGGDNGGMVGRGALAWFHFLSRYSTACRQATFTYTTIRASHERLLLGHARGCSFPACPAYMRPTHLTLHI